MANSILLIDDELEFVSMLQLGLEAEGYIVHTAANPVIGLKEMERCQPDVLLVDWEMPKMNGIEFIKILKQQPAHSARYIIMITGRGETKDIVAGLDAGADDYLIKPFQIEELSARVRSGLRILSLEQRIAEEAKRLTVLEMALSVADKIGNPIAAAKFNMQVLEDNPAVKQLPEVLESIRTLEVLLDEALNLINQFQSIKTPHSIPAPGGRTMIAPE